MASGIFFIDKSGELIDGISLQKSDIHKRPGIKFAILTRGNNLKQFLEVSDWYLERVKEAFPKKD